MIDQVSEDYAAINRLNVIVSHVNGHDVIDENEISLAASPTIAKFAPKMKPKASVQYNNAHIGVYCKPKATCEKRTHPTGEDSYMFASNGTMTALGVADGVGGWSEYGVDPSIVSYQIMQNYKSIFVNGSKGESDDGKEKLMDVEDQTKIDEELPLPKRVLVEAYNQLFTQRQVEAGSTTACVVTLDNSLRLSYANLGDSGFLVVRPSTGESIFRSREQQHCKYFFYQSC
jgi:hypothetical protein